MWLLFVVVLKILFEAKLKTTELMTFVEEISGQLPSSGSALVISGHSYEDM